MERRLRKRKLAVSIIYLAFYYFGHEISCENVFSSHCGWSLLFSFLPAKCWTIAIVALTSDPIRSGALLFACQSHAHGSYREGGSGLYVVSLKCLIKVSTCCSLAAPNPTLTTPMSFVWFAYNYMVYMYIRGGYTGDSYVWYGMCVKGFHFISFRLACSGSVFFFLFSLLSGVICSLYTSLLAKCRLLSAKPSLSFSLIPSLSLGSNS